ncbi:Nramp family divalent metal transporter [Streptomyces sp. NBC_01471]|uniref:Nramp family divalent metal transporter n=1 Tax=Streptomyces sp. NBC_01471 TaxID=2903879 RepID=UPI00324CF5BF
MAGPVVTKKSTAPPPAVSAADRLPQTAPVGPAGTGTGARRPGRLRAAWSMFGPAFVAAIAYVDPGNFATNIYAGAHTGYQLVWVVLAASILAMPIQYLSAKVGIVTGRTLPELCRERYPRPVLWCMWAQAELVAMATDLAEFIGAAIGLNLLFGVPLFTAGLITAAAAFLVLGLQTRGYRPFERAIAFLFVIVCAGFAYELFRIGPDTRATVGGLVPDLSGHGTVYLAAGIVGATVMPHIVYLHSALTTQRTQGNTAAEHCTALRYERCDIVIALGAAGAVNLVMLLIAAKLFHGTLSHEVTTIAQAHAELSTLVGGGAALAFAVALVAAGISSSSVGTYAGQVIMSGFLGLRLPLFARRGITMVPALAVLLAGADPTAVLVLSQVVLSLGIPFALVPLVLITGDSNVMGRFANPAWLTKGMWAATATITALNATLLYQQFLG